MIHQLLIGICVIAATVALHAVFMGLAFDFFRGRRVVFEGRARRAGLTAAIVLWFFLSICLQCWGWAVLFIGLGVFPTLEEALYFATVTYTTLGFGDVLLPEAWRLLGAFSAANGMIIFGWTTALVFFAVEKIYSLQAPEELED